MSCIPTLSGVLSPSQRLEGKAVVPVQQITWVTPCEEVKEDAKTSKLSPKLQNYSKAHFLHTSNIAGSKSLRFLVSPFHTYQLKNFWQDHQWKVNSSKMEVQCQTNMVAKKCKSISEDAQANYNVHTKM